MTGCYSQWSVGQLTAVFSEMLWYAMQQEQQQQKYIVINLKTGI